MAKFTDALRGYAFDVHQRDGFKCRYCGLDGTASFENWSSLSWDHLLPKDHPKRDDPEYIVTACKFCNTADNRYFDYLEARGLTIDNMTPAQLMNQRQPFVLKTRSNYTEFWNAQVSAARERSE
jgi:Fe-S oxidoreductase